MNYYFRLQFRRINRRWMEFGLHPAIGNVLMILLFFIFSILLFQKTDFALYIYIGIALYFLINTSDRKKLNTINEVFTKREQIYIRLVENLIISAPFIGFLIFKTEYIFALSLCVLSLAMVFIVSGTFSFFKRHTIFSKHPFEFTAGLRVSLIFTVFIYLLCIIAIQVGNYNLGAFSIALICLQVMGFYIKAEHQIFLWIFKFNPIQFLVYKSKWAIAYSLLLCIPIIILLTIYFPSKFGTTILILLIGLLDIVMIIMAKYSTYPKEANIAMALLITLTLVFPPLLLFCLPYFYFRSLKQLNPILQ